MFQIADGISLCKVNHSERKYFDELVPLKTGTSYNSYIVRGTEKTALIDASYQQTASEFFRQIEGLERLDYIVANHGEQDHSGLLPEIMRRYPNAKLLTNAKCRGLILDAMSLDESRVETVDESSSYDLGGKTLKFYMAPWVHWPDTMFTFVPETRVLFTCDFLGAHSTLDACFAPEDESTLAAAKTYYAEIMMPYRAHCAKYIKLVREIDPLVICPSHGSAYDNPEFILRAYEAWTADACKKLVAIPYVSMYGNSVKMAEYLSEKLSERGVSTVMVDVVNGDLGEYLKAIVDAGAIVYASSVVLAFPHPAMANIVYLTNLLKPKAKYFAVIGSLGWGGMLVKRITDMLATSKPELIGDVVAKGKPTAEDFARLSALAQTIAERLA